MFRIIDELYEAECLKIEEMPKSKQREKYNQAYDIALRKLESTLTIEQREMLDEVFAIDTEIYLDREKYAYKLGFKTGLFIYMESKNI